jgi:Tfp pilus assembly protein PilV
MNSDDIYRKKISEVGLTGLAELCGNVAHNRAASRTQADTAYSLRAQWLLMSLDHATESDKESLKKRMADFLADIPAWMRNGTS